MGYSALLRTALVLALGLAVVVVSACSASIAGESDNANGDLAGSASYDEPRGVMLEHTREAPDFELVAHTGDTFRLSDAEGDVVAIFFGYTGCPDVCPLTLSHMAHATERLDDYAENVTFLFVTVDPERDTTERLSQYIRNLDAPLVALTGDPDDLADVREHYDIAIQRHDRDDGTYLIDHSAHVWLISPSGERVGFLPMGADGDDLANDIGWLLEQERK
jgi:protein SCO1